MKRTTKLLGLIVLLALAILPALGCNTVRGVGKDVQAGGQALENAAKK